MTKLSLLTREPTLLTRVDAVLDLPAGTPFSDYYRSIRLQRWDDDENDSVVTHSLFQPRDEALPWVLCYDGDIYRQGQCSGPAMSLVWYDLEEHM